MRKLHVWKSGASQTPIKHENIPGECMYVDSFESSTKGMIAQIKGNLTVIYRYAKGSDQQLNPEIKSGISKLCHVIWC